MNNDRHAMVIKADARAMGAVTALSTTNRRKPRERAAASVCVSYHASDKSDATIFSTPRTTPTTTKTTKVVVAQHDAGADYFARLARFGSING